MTDFWRKNDGDPVALPFMDTDPDGNMFSDLADNQEGRAACGWAPAPAAPSYDPATQRLIWTDGAWRVEAWPVAPRVISALGFKQRLTPQERIGIRAAAASDVVIADFLDLLDTPGQGLIELDHADTIAGVEYLVAHELLTRERADALRA